MIIKFSDNFDSIFYAVLLNNLTGFLIVSKNNYDFFDEEKFIDIDQLNHNKILQEHDQRFGPIRWINRENSQFLYFANIIEEILKSKNNQNSYQAFNLIKLALKFGLLASEVNIFLNQCFLPNKSNRLSNRQRQLAI